MFDDADDECDGTLTHCGRCKAAMYTPHLPADDDLCDLCDGVVARQGYEALCND